MKIDAFRYSGEMSWSLGVTWHARARVLHFQAGRRVLRLRFKLPKVASSDWRGLKGEHARLHANLYHAVRSALGR